MSFLDWVISSFAPYECLGCGAEGALLCPDCCDLLPSVPERCYRCRRVSKGARTCSSCRKVSKLETVYVVTDYEGIAKSVVRRLKFHGAQATARQIAHTMAQLVRDSYTIVPVPTASSRVRQRGYDQAHLIGRQLARQTALPYRGCLRRRGQSHQVSASRNQRIKQLKNAFRVSKQLPDTSILLVDDVLTTGATLEAAAAVLKQAGVKHIHAIVFAQA